MSIAFTTMGKLIPQYAVYREQYSGMDAGLYEVDVIESNASEFEQIQAILTSDGLTVELQLLDSITGTIADETFDVDIDCSIF